MIDIPSPAVAVVGRHNSGKTTLVVKLIEELTARGRDVGSVKHHHRTGFEFDVPGKDSYRHRHAGATETVVAAPDQLARVKTLSSELECAQIVRSMPGHDIVIVEGYRKSGLPTIEVMRAANEADAAVAHAFVQGAIDGDPEKIFAACLFDPLTSAVCSMKEIHDMVQEMLDQNAPYLSYFKTLKLR